MFVTLLASLLDPSLLVLLARHYILRFMTLRPVPQVAGLFFTIVIVLSLGFLGDLGGLRGGRGIVGGGLCGPRTGGTGTGLFGFRRFLLPYPG